MTAEIKKTAKALVVQGLTCLGDRRHLRTLVRRDAQIAAASPRVDLTPEEKALLRFPSDVYQFQLYKKVWGNLQYGFISDAYYQLRLLPQLHKMDYVLNRERPGGNLFMDKNYFDLFLQL